MSDSLSQTSITGYSDRINHALAFAAKHHDQQVRRGVRLPYLTHPANVAIILTRYGQNDDTVIAGILLNVVRDYVNDGHSPALIGERIGDKFGAAVLETMLSIVPRRSDADGVDRSFDERRSDSLARLAEISDAARWVIAADALHDCATLLADVRRTIDPSVVWAGRTHGVGMRWYRELLRGLQSAGFAANILDELEHVLAALEKPR
jgi:(p)ppGpp synthase/HD superfamily hydrolase